MPKILIVEDDKMLLSIYELKIKEAGFEIFSASDGYTGLEIARKEGPDLILLDIILPKMDGFAVLKALREDENSRNIPVLIITNLGQEEDMEKGKTFGAQGYLVKAHFSPKDIVNEVNKWIIKIK